MSATPQPDAAGVFISFEGIDGAGKTSHIDALADAFRHAGRTVLRTREPGGTPLAETLRGLVLHQPMDALTEALLVFAGRRDHLVTVILPALARGEVVLCDRFTDATFAYQGGGRGFDTETLSKLEQFVQSGRWLQGDLTPNPALIEPQLTLWFDLPAAVAAQRLVAARQPDRFESEPAAFFQRVAAAYAQRAARAPARIARIDANQPRDAVWAQIQGVVAARGWL